MDKVLRLVGGVGSLLLMLAAVTGGTPRAATARQATPPPVFSCDAATPTATSGGATGGMAGMDMGTPPAGMDMAMEVEFDQLYIDMMIPHHAAILAMAQAALPRLEDPRLVAIAEAIVAAQGLEIEELRGYRAAWYGSPDPVAMDAHTMGMLDEQMPGMGTMDAMAFQMDAAAQVAAFCTAADADLAFIELTIPHHEMAITASEAALARAVHPELQDVAQRVIDAQQREIEELTAIRGELTGDATPAAG
jgi:uncharacterized protein (DUF305 family)